MLRELLQLLRELIVELRRFNNSLPFIEKQIRRNEQIQQLRQEEQNTKKEALDFVRQFGEKKKTAKAGRL